MILSGAFVNTLKAFHALQQNTNDSGRLEKKFSFNLIVNNSFESKVGYQIKIRDQNF